VSNGPQLSKTASAIRASVFADLQPRIDAFTRAGGELIALHIGDTHVMPPEGARVERVAQAPSEAELYRYGAITGTMALREACASRLRACGRGPRDVSASNVLLGVGATHAIFCAARAVLDPGDEVLVASPYWPLTVGVLHAAGARPVEVPLTARLYENTACDAGALFEERITPRTRAIYVITPNNPDGKVLSRAELESIAKVARARDLWVFADEVYADYTFDVPHVSIASLDGMEERTISSYSFSKSYALAGARVGYVAAPARVVAAAMRVSTHTVFNVPLVAQRLAMAALASGDAWMDDARREYRAARDDAARALDGANVRYHLAEGGTYLFIDFEPVLGARPLTQLLERAIDRGVLLAPGDACGRGFERWARLCFTSVPRAKVLAGIERLRDAIASL
jgi:aspartate/methionine/tyrosine aminotransferase